MCHSSPGRRSALLSGVALGWDGRRGDLGTSLFTGNKFGRSGTRRQCRRLVWLWQGFIPTIQVTSRSLLGSCEKCHKSSVTTQLKCCTHLYVVWILVVLVRLFRLDLLSSMGDQSSKRNFAVINSITPQSCSYLDFRSDCLPSQVFIWGWIVSVLKKDYLGCNKLPYSFQKNCLPQSCYLICIPYHPLVGVREGVCCVCSILYTMSEFSALT